MDRDYKNGKSKSVGLFSGIEIEHTPAHGLQTLFLARNDLTYEQITDLCKEVKAKAVYYGANRAYIHSHFMQVKQIEKLLDDGYYVTVDYPHSLHAEVKEKFKNMWKNEKFIPVCSIIFPYSEEDDQVYMKLDDVDFRATGPGVWTMSMNHFKQSAGFTSWDEYKQDEPIEEKTVWPIPAQKV